VFKVQGRTVWRSLGTDDREQAKAILAEEIKKAKRVDLKAAHSLTLDGLLDLYDRTLNGVAPGTAENRRCLIKTFRRTWEFGIDLKVASVTTAHLRAWLACHRPRLSNLTWNAYLRFLRALFDLALEAHAGVENPAGSIDPLRLETPARPTPAWEEFKAIVADVRSQKFNARARQGAELIEFMGTLGLGQAEVANLRGEHFDFERHQITVLRQKTRKAFVIPMYPQALPLLDRLKAQGRIRPGQPVFINRTPEVALRHACTRLNLPHYSPRSLRRMFIVRALEKGVDPRVCASWQGHRDATLVLRVYGHIINAKHAQEMAARLV
jgi:integrase